MSRARSRRPWPRPARPPLFVHPAEASHGDLGMITAGDAVLALSNSGETAELARHRQPTPAASAFRWWPSPAAPQRARRRGRRRRCCCRGAARPARWARADHLDHHDAGAGRRAGGGAAGAQRLLGRGFPASASRAASSAQRCCGSPTSCMRRRAAAGRRRTRRCRGDDRDDRQDASAASAWSSDGRARRHHHRRRLAPPHDAPDLLARPSRDVMTPQPRTIRADALAAEAVGVMNERVDHRAVRGRRRQAGRHRAHPRSASSRRGVTETA